MRGWKVIASALMLWVSSFAHSFDFNSNYYSVYETGAVPNTNGCVYVYIVPKSSFLIIGVDQPTPIMFMPQTTGFQALSCPDGTLSGFTKVNLTANDMALQGAVPSTRYKMFGGDFDGDGKSDFFLQGNDTVLNSVVLTADATGTPQIHTNFYGALGSGTYTQINILDVDQNGRSDIVATDMWGNVNTQMLNGSGGSYSAPGMTQMLVGSINGKFRVDESGNSTYSVDVLTAAGTAGVTPHISLNYSSGAGDGVMGTGWSIGGLSAVSRCRQTLSQDNNTTAIKLDANDRFCLDGQRLILTSGTYGAPGSTYRTEVDSYAVITANGGSTGNPAYFTVVRKDGSTSYYGNGNGSQLVLNGNGPVLTWAISRFQDNVGNPIRFSYVTDPATNEQLINRIDYGYGSNTGATNDSSTYLSFNYENRTDVSSGYVAGFKIQRTKRLKSIYSFNNGSEIRRYTPAYRTTDSVHYQSYVQQLFECVGGSCLSPTTFNWSLNSGGFQTTTATVGTLQTPNAATSMRKIDINGDGKPDLIYMASYVYGFKYYYQLWNGSGYSAPVFITWSNTSAFYPLVLDKNHDGYEDVMIPGMVGGWELYLGSPTGLGSKIDTGISTEVGFQTMDVDSDGLTDLVMQGVTAGSIEYQLTQRTNVNGQWSYSSSSTINAAVNFGDPGCPYEFAATSLESPVDFNGDGRVDIPVAVFSIEINVGSFNVTSCASSALVSSGAGLFNAAPWLSNELAGGAYSGGVDLNNDGLTDSFWRDSVNNNQQYAFNTGGGVGNLSSPAVLSGSNESWFFADYNNDGHLDALSTSASNLTVLTVKLYSPGSGTFDAASTIAFPASCEKFMDIDADGDGNTDLLCFYLGAIKLFKSNDAGSAGNKIVSFDNGLGNTTTLAYKPLTDPSVYTKGHDANDATKWPDVPVFDIVSPSYVVASVSSTAPRADSNTPKAVNYGATNSVNYQYAGLKAQALGRGSLGFASITEIDNQSGVKTTTTYNQNFPFVGQPLTTTLTSSTGLVFKTSTNTQSKIDRTGADGTKYYQVYTPTVIEQMKDPVGGWEISYVVTNTAQPDEWGNVWGSAGSPGIVATTYASDHINIVKRMSTYNEYGSGDYDKQFARLSKTVVTHSRPGQNDITRTSQFSYYGSGDGNLRGLLKTEQAVTPDGSTSALKTTQYDAFGNKRCVSVGSDANTASNCTPATGNRYEIVNYDTAGRYAVSKQSPFKKGAAWADEITEQVITRNALGLPTQVSGLNGIVTNFSYDALGREISRSDNSGAMVTTTYARYGISGAQYNVITSANTGATSVQYFDVLGRGIAKWQRGYDGRWITSETEYDSVGRVKRQSVPHYDNDTIYWATNNYDAFRLQNQSSPATGNILATASMVYGASGGLTYTEMTNALGQKRKEFANAAGESVKVTDNLLNDIVYTYDPAGQLIQTSISGKQGANTVTLNTYLEYDQLGRKIKMRDSSKGTWFYQYNAFGDLTGQYKVMSTNNYSGTLAQALADSSVTLQYTAMNYDNRGRMISRQDLNYANGAGSVVDAWQWTYDTATNGVGQLTQEQQITGGAFARTYSYDVKGRPASTMHNDGNASYVLTVEYDSFGRPYKNTDALGTGSGTINSYNAYGYVQSVLDLAGNTTLYSVQNMNAQGQVTSAIYGNGATTSWVYDQGSGLLTNLTTTSALGVTLQRLDYTWDVLGNQTSRWDRGYDNTQSGSPVYKNLQQSFCYDALNRLTKSHQSTLSGSCSLTAAQQDQQYDDFGNITSKNNIGTYTYNTASAHQLQSTGDGVSYTYDKVGNLISDTSGRTLTYTVFDKVASVSKGANQITYAYGPDRNYYKRTDTASGVTSTTYYIGNVEKVVKADGSYDMKRNLAGVALFNHHFNSAGTQTSVDKQFIYKDVIDSVVLITDNTGTVKQQLAYNSWGERVDKSNWQTVLPSTTFLPVSQQFTTRSYTGQSAMDAIGLINYGGRIYDPRIARFVQADPFIPDSSNLQSFNRYAYVRNNPLTLVDPSGFVDVIPTYINGYVDPKSIDKINVTAEGPWSTWESIQSGALSNGTYGSQFDSILLSISAGSQLEGSNLSSSVSSNALTNSSKLSAKGKINTAAMSGGKFENGKESRDGEKSKESVDEVLVKAKRLVAEVKEGLSWWAQTGLASAQSSTWSDAGDKILQGLPPIVGAPAKLSAAGLPKALTLGKNAKAGVDVYLGIRNGKAVYCGITCNLAARASQHGARFDSLQAVTTSPVTRGEARAIEQALIENNSGFENIRNSISPTHSFYQEAVDWGTEWLKANGY